MTHVDFITQIETGFIKLLALMQQSSWALWKFKHFFSSQHTAVGGKKKSSYHQLTESKNNELVDNERGILLDSRMAKLGISWERTTGEAGETSLYKIDS